jgi:sigma-B regulation protein RsbU (phosphoserine phosphatase)
MYLLDVCGHGVGPSLMSVAVLHALRSASHRAVDFRKPAQVLESLNNIYQMQNSNDLYFTIWYGVYRPADRQLEYACAGHPPALLIDAIPSDTVLYLVSDGTYEVEKPGGGMLNVNDLAQFLSRSTAGASDLDEWWKYLVQVRGGTALEDDYSLVRFHF